MDNIPEPWASAMTAQNFVDGRGSGRPSWRSLSKETGVHPSTLSAMAAGTRTTSVDVLQRVAHALRVDIQTVSGWANQVRALSEPYSPPDDANMLDDEERAAVDRIITLLARSKKRGSSDGRQPDAQKTPDAPPHVVDVTQPPARRRPVIRFPRPYDPDNPEVQDGQERTAARDGEPKGARNPGQDAAGEENQDGTK